MAQAFFGGVHPNDMKAATNEKAIEKLEAPAEVVIPMSMHIGAPCKPIVAVGDKVKIGQRIGEPGGFVSAPIHASVSGTVKAVEPRPYLHGRHHDVRGDRERFPGHHQRRREARG